MSITYRQLARFSSPGSRPRKKATMVDRLATLYDCFSELDTEKSFQPNGQIAYVESLLRMQKPQHLSETQREMRDLLLDLLLVYSNGRSNGKVDTNTPDDTICSADGEGSMCAACFLLTHTAGKGLAQKVCRCNDLRLLDVDARMQLLAWLNGSGITAKEWEMIQPRFASLLPGMSAPQAAPTGIHPLFFRLQKSSQDWMRDYLTRAFIGTRSLWQMGTDLTHLPSRSLSVATVLLDEFNEKNDKPATISHFPKLTFSRSF